MTESTLEMPQWLRYLGCASTYQYSVVGYRHNISVIAFSICQGDLLDHAAGA